MKKNNGTKKFSMNDYKDLVDLSDYDMTTKQCIMAKCKECSGFSSHEARLCNNKSCALYKPYSFYIKR